MGSPIGGRSQDGGDRGGGSGSCLIMFGLTFDATEREVHILFSGCAGYVRCIVVPGKGSNQKPYAFIQFDSQDSAVAGLESRQNTSWEEGAQACKIEVSKRDIPDRFQPRQARMETNYGPPAHVLPPLPPAKRQRFEEARAPEPPSRYSPRDAGGYASPVEDGPRTLHVGGLPDGMQQADLDDFLGNNFGSECIGGKLAGGGRGGAARAFVGFVSHDAAGSAQGQLEGLLWEGNTLHAEWARTEFRVPGQGGGDTAAQYAPQHPEPAWGAPPHKGHHSSYEKGFNGQSKGHHSSHEKGGHGPSTWRSPVGKGGGDKGGGEPRCTLHFTNLPHVSDTEFGEFMSVTFPDQVTFSRFVDKADGRPPVAWVRFVDEATASDVAGSHARFDWMGTQVGVQFARTELDPNKAR